MLDQCPAGIGSAGQPLRGAMARSKFNQKNRKPTKKVNPLKEYKKKVKAAAKREAKKVANRQRWLKA